MLRYLAALLKLRGIVTVEPDYKIVGHHTGESREFVGVKLTWTEEEEREV